MLSRVDGRTTVEDIADSTGATVAQVEELLHKLEAASILVWVEETVPRSAHRPAQSVGGQPTEKSAPSERPRRASITPGRGIKTRPRPPGAPRVLYDPAELEEEVDLDLDRRREILDCFYRLKDMSHYELLGVASDAEKKAIRDAYFRLSKRFHPDTLYGKNLGSYKSKMESVFKRLTDAYEVLGKKKRRREYDTYLQAVEQTRRLLAGIDETERVAQQIERESELPPQRLSPNRTASVEPKPEVKPEAKSPSPVHVASPVPEPKPRPSKPVRARFAKPSEPGMPAVTPTTSSTPPRKTVSERRALARELLEKRLAGQRRTSQLRPPEPVSSDSSRPERTSDQMLKGLARTIRESASVTGGNSGAERHLKSAKDAEADNDLLGAVNSLRLAMAIAPERDDIEAEYARVRQTLAIELAETFEKQARYEEGQGHWEAAARSWERVAEGRPEAPGPLRRAAAALAEAETDLKKARDFAQKAVSLQPDSAQNHAVLGQVFIKAGMLASAKTELEAALKLDPNNDFVKNLLRELK